MSDDVTLLPCPNPWCSESDLVVEYRRDVWRAERPQRVECQCGMHGPDAASEAAAIAAWNTRTPSPDSGERMREDDEIIGEFAFLYRAYGLAADETLAPDALALKRKVLAALQESAR